MVLQVEPKKLDILGIPLSLVSKGEALGVCRDILSGRLPSGYIVTLNPEIVAMALKNSELLAAIKNSALVVPDGVGITWAAKKLHGLTLERVPGIELAEALISLCAQEGFPVFFLGSRPKVAEKASLHFREIYPSLKIAGTFHGFFSEKEKENVARAIQEAGTILLVVGMGAGKQEKFLLSFPRAHQFLGITVGGALEIWAGEKSRAPLWMRKSGLEWLYRALKEPKRFLRLAKALSFFLRILWQSAKR